MIDSTQSFGLDSAVQGDLDRDRPGPKGRLMSQEDPGKCAAAQLAPEREPQEVLADGRPGPWFVPEFGTVAEQVRVGLEQPVRSQDAPQRFLMIRETTAELVEVGALPLFGKQTVFLVGKVEDERPGCGQFRMGLEEDRRLDGTAVPPQLLELAKQGQGFGATSG
jgi:hypothetical protein